MPIQPGQTYRAADPRDSIRIRIKTYVPGENRALVVDAATGKRPRPMLVTALHDSATTQAGKPRRSGYVLEQPTAGIRDAARTAAAIDTASDTAQHPTAQTGQQPDETVVAYRNSGRPGVLLCREHGEGWMGLTPLTSDDLPEGGLCTWRTSGADQCGRDVLIPSVPDPTTADDPTPLRWGLGDVLHGDDDTTTVCLSGPDREPYWLELEPEQRDVLRADLAAPETIEPQDHPGADLYVRLRKAGEDHDTALELIYAHARMTIRQHQALNATPAAGLDASQPATDQARASLDRVRALHARNEPTGDCEECSQRDYPDYSVPHPCPTIRALDDSQPNVQEDEPR
ncbi:hypothetical protein [Streptomyces hydrogenans]|uniref:hypothetical protein n=1 Tax=Streptomyces hydrogenans TaxID=1873719 RepID=UPI00381F1C8D